MTVSEEFQEAMEKFKEAQRVEEIAQEQLCDSRERHDKDFQEMQETMFKVKVEKEELQVARLGVREAKRMVESAHTQVESVIDACQWSTRPPRNV